MNKETNDQPSSKLPPEEQLVLKLLHGLDEPVGKGFYDEYLNIVSYWVIDGVPCKLVSKPIHSSYHGKENPVTYTPSRIVKRYNTDSKKLLFVSEYGHYMSYKFLQDYSKKSGLAKTFPEPLYNLNKASKPVEPSQKNEVELRLLARLAAGEFNGPINHHWYAKGGSLHWNEIKDGIPIQYSQGKDRKVFNGKENEIIPGKVRIYRKYETDDEKLEFFRKFGRDMDDQEAFDYSWQARQKRYHLH